MTLGAKPALAVTDPILTSFAGEVGVSGPVTVRGGKTRWAAGGPLAAGTCELMAPHGIVSYTPAEMTVKVRAGTMVAELESVLSECGQRCGLPDRGGTVGGAVAVGENHVAQRRRGTVAAAVLQVRYVSADGRLVTGGGPTVKNVTGFDLPRLMVGSLGTLGLLAELIIRTNPVPEVSCWLEASGVDPFRVNDRLLRPSAVLWDGERTWVNLEGHRGDVAAEQAALAAHGRFIEVAGPPPLPAFRWSLVPSDLRTLGTGAQPWGDEPWPASSPPPGGFVASVGVGTVWADVPQPPRELDPAAAAICRRLKETFDPPARLNPGRSLGTY
jgi:glycolate oxidase FAD binding subunit